MPVDIETEIAQMWAGSRAIAGLLKDNLPTRNDSLTISSVGLRSGRDTQIAGLAQILNFSQSFTLELAIKALYMNMNPESNPENTHDLIRLFNSLSKDIKIRLRSKWAKAPGRTHIGKNLSLDEFLKRYSLTFETSRYLYESSKSYSVSTMDFNIAIWIITSELISRQSDKTLLHNIVNMLSHEDKL